MTPLAAFALAGCFAVQVGSDHISAGDLAAAFPAWGGIAPTTTLALAPAPGVQRILHVPELRAMAARWNVTPAPDKDVCFIRPATAVDPARLLAAMQKQLPGAKIEILEFSRQPAPDGDLEFPIAGLRQAPGGGYWNGYVTYAGNRRFVLWAKVKVLATAPRVIAVESLQPGRAVDAAQLRLEMRDEFPGAGRFTASIDQAAGRIPRRAIAAGTPLRMEWLEAPKEVMRGDTVKVEVVMGGARLELEAQAEASGAIGDTIRVLNPVSKRRFPARVDGKGKVSVTKGIL